MPGLNRSCGPMLPILAWLLAGCAGPAGPRPVARDAGHVTALAAAEQAMRRDCLGLAEPGNRSEDAAARRNRLLHDLMVAIDQRYYEYELQLLAARGSRDNSAAPALRTIERLIADDARARRAAHIDGARPRGRAERDRLRAQILAILQTQMRTNRTEKRDVIIRRLELPYESWSTCLALADVMAYEQTGTLDAALSVLAELAAAAARAAEAAERER